MVTRAERAEQAIELAGAWENLLWVLAVNATPVRRAYLEELSELKGRPLVRALAKMANQGILAETGGLEFELDRQVFGTELRARVPAGIARDLHERSLVWGEANAPANLAFRVNHLVGAARWPEASDLVLEPLAQRAAQGQLASLADVARAKTVLIGLMDQTGENRGRIIELGIHLLESCRHALKPGEVKNLIASLRELEPSADLVERLVAVEAAAREEAKSRRKKSGLTEEGESSLGTESAAVAAKR